MTRYDSRPFRLTIAVAAAVAAIGLRLATDSLTGWHGPWLWFVLAVTLSAWFGGFKPGIITAGPLLLAGYYLDVTRSAASVVTSPELTPSESPAFSALLFSFTAFAICAA